MLAVCDKDDESTDMVLDYLSDNGDTYNGDTDNRCSILVYAFKDLIESGKMDINSDGIISFKNSICKYTQTVILTVCVYFSLISNPLTLSRRSTNLNEKNMQICCLFEI